MSAKSRLYLAIFAAIGLATVEPMGIFNAPGNVSTLEPTVVNEMPFHELSDVWLVVSYFQHQFQLLNTDVGKQCNFCKLAMAYVKWLVDAKVNEEMAVHFTATVCTVVKIKTPAFCYGVIKALLPEILFIFKSVEDEISIDNICAFVLDGGCVFPPTYLETFDWRVTFPSAARPAVSDPNPNSPGSIVKIVHISDTHWDKEYAVGAINNCKEPVCCRNSVTAADNETIHLSGKFGGLNGGCDIPKETLESAFQFISNNINYDYVYWTGDVPPHDYHSQSKEENLDIIQSTADLVKSYFSRDNTVFATCGNHEADPVDSFPVPVVYDQYDVSYLYNKLSAVWSNFLPNVDQSTILKGGYYAFDVEPRLRLISLNMNYCLRGNFFLLMQFNDPTGELQWLIQQLDDCEKKNIKAHIIGHIPPGWCTWVWARNYREILARYSDVIAGHFYGHTHNDEFEIIFNDEIATTDPISVAFIGPSLTTYTNVNPSFRVYYVDDVTWKVLDYETYYLDIDIANSVGIPEWKLLFTAKSFYNLSDLSATCFNNLVSRMEVNDTLFQQFYRNMLRVENVSDCVDECKSNILCSLRIDWPGRNVKCAGGLVQTF